MFPLLSPPTLEYGRNGWSSRSHLGSRENFRNENVTTETKIGLTLWSNMLALKFRIWTF